MSIRPRGMTRTRRSADRHDTDRHDADRHDADRHDMDRHDMDRHDMNRHRDSWRSGQNGAFAHDALVPLDVPSPDDDEPALQRNDAHA